MSYIDKRCWSNDYVLQQHDLEADGCKGSPWGRLKRRWESSLEVFFVGASLPGASDRCSVSDRLPSSPSPLSRRHCTLAAIGIPTVGRRAKAAIANPFYALLVVAGIAFSITAFAYGVMAFRAVSPQGRADRADNHPLLKFLERRGAELLMAEIGVLAIATFAAMATDDYWTRRSNRQMTDASSSPVEERPPGENSTSDN